MVFSLYPHQLEALDKLKSGAVLCGEVGSGKTLTGLAYYKKYHSNKDLYIITTAKKRNTGDWEDEALLLDIQDIVVDSWNNIKKYTTIKNAFFIFDEQRVVGYGTWTKAFLVIAKCNPWILLTGTPGDVWMDYLPVFLANGYYKNKTDFIDQHVEFDRFVSYPKIKKYHNEGKLYKLRKNVLVNMPMVRKTKRIHKMITCEYDKELIKVANIQRWNPYTDAPIVNASEYTQTLRRIVASDINRQRIAKWLLDIHDKVIVFYNYNYELEILISLCEATGKPYSQWNGKKHQEIPDTDDWIYLVQYTAGAEGWNCITTNAIIFYSANYSYKIMEQAEGRIDRLNTKFIELEYFYLTSKSEIDKAVLRAVETKKQFNESIWARKAGGHDFRE